MATTLGNFLSGEGVPSNGDGANGDHYRNTSNQDLWFKSSGLWSLIGNLYNGIPDGVGTVIQDGSGNPSNLNGENGYYYRDRDNQNFWFKVEGIWHLLCRLGGVAEGGGGGGAADCTLQVTQWVLPDDYTYAGTGVPYPIEPIAGDGQIIELSIPYDDAFLLLPSNVGTDVSFILRLVDTSLESATTVTLATTADGARRIKFPPSAFPYINFRVFLSTLGEPHVEVIELGAPQVWGPITAVEGQTYPEATSGRRDHAGFIRISTGDAITDTFQVISEALNFRDNIQVHIEGSSGRINNLTVGDGGSIAPRPVYPGDVLRVVREPATGGSWNTKLIVERTSYVNPPATMVLNSTANTTLVVDVDKFQYPGGFMWNTTSASPVSVEFPTPLSLGMTMGQSQAINIRQGGTGVVTLTPTGGASIEGTLVFSSQYEVKTVMSKDDSTWIAVGA